MRHGQANIKNNSDVYSQAQSLFFPGSERPSFTPMYDKRQFYY